MARCPSCGHDSDHEFCGVCGEYAGRQDGHVAPAPHVPAADAVEPDAVLPGPQRARALVRRAVAAPEERRADDVHCGECGTYSAAGRTFCRHCGAPLAAVAPAVVERPSWWRRVAAAVARRPPVATGPIGPGHVLPAPRAHRWPGLVALAALVAAAVLVAPPAARAVVRALSADYEQVRPSAAYGHGARGHQAPLLVDGITNTSWRAWPKSRRSPRHAVVRIAFPGPVDLDRIGVTQGAGERPEAFARYARGARLAVTFDDGTTGTVRLADEPGFQSAPLRARGVRWVRLTFVTEYAASVPRHGVAVSEVEFFRLR